MSQMSSVPSAPAHSNVYTALLAVAFLIFTAGAVYIGLKNISITKAEQDGGSNPFFVLPRENP